jgi:hypothetical protein
MAVGFVGVVQHGAAVKMGTVEHLRGRREIHVGMGVGHVVLSVHGLVGLFHVVVGLVGRRNVQRRIWREERLL